MSRLRRRQLPGDPAARAQPPARRPRRSHVVVPGIAGRGQLDVGAADHRHRRHDRRALAAVLPAVEHHRQADHAALDQLRARRHGDRLVRRRDRRRRADRASPLSRLAAPRTSATSPTRARSRRELGQQLGSAAGTLFAIVLLNASHDRRGRGDPGDLLRVRRRLRRQPLAAPGLLRREGLLRELHAAGVAGRRHRADPGRSARRDHDRRAGARRRAAADRDGVPAAALQRPRGARARG